MVKLNRRATVKRWSWVKNDQGGLDPVLIDEWTKWMQMDDRSGSTSNTLTARTGTSFVQNEQQVWQTFYKVVMRYELSRPTKSNDTIDYGGQRLKIENVSLINEGFKHYELCRCSVVDEYIDNGNPILTEDGETILTEGNEIITT